VNLKQTKHLLTVTQNNAFYESLDYLIGWNSCHTEYRRTASLQCELARVISGVQAEWNSCHNMSSMNSLMPFQMIRWTLREQINLHNFFLITFTAAAQGMRWQNTKFKNMQTDTFKIKAQLKQDIIKARRGQ